MTPKPKKRLAKLTRCNGKECRLHTGPVCGCNFDKTSLHCSRKKGHKGSHIACGLYVHNLATWK